MLLCQTSQVHCTIMYMYNIVVCIKLCSFSVQKSCTTFVMGVLLHNFLFALHVIHRVGAHQSFIQKFLVGEEGGVALSHTVSP